MVLNGEEDRGVVEQCGEQWWKVDTVAVPEVWWCGELDGIAVRWAVLW